MRFIRLAKLPKWNSSYSSYLKHSAVLFGWLAARALAMAGAVIILTRTIGAAGYGSLTAQLAIATFFSPLAGLGMHGVLLREGSRHPLRLPTLFGQAIRLWWLSAAAASLMAVATSWLIFPENSGPAVAAIIISEVISSSLIELLARSEQSRHNISRYGSITSGLPVFRLISLILYLSIEKPSLHGWMWSYAIASTIYSAVVFLRFSRELRPIFRQATHWSLARRGLPFAAGLISMRLQAEFNKPVLARMDYALAGNFSAAQRVTDIVTLPLMAMQEALWPKLYRSSNHRQRILVSGLLIFGLALIAGALITIAAPLLIRIFGPGFEPAIKILRLIAWIPALQILRNFASFHVTATHQQNLLTGAYAIGVSTGIISTLLLASHFGTTGIIASIYLTETVITTTILAFGTRKNINI